MSSSPWGSNNWGEQACNEARAWHAYKPDHTRRDEADLDIFAAGHDQGWRDAISTLRLHGIIRTEPAALAPVITKVLNSWDRDPIMDFWAD